MITANSILKLPSSPRIEAESVVGSGVFVVGPSVVTLVGSKDEGELSVDKV